MKSIMRKKTMYLLLLLVICLAGIGIKGTYAKFVGSGETSKDIVSLNLTFNISISNIEEYEEISVDASSHKTFNVSLTNASTSTIYYGIWYQMVSPVEKTEEITIARNEDNAIATSGSIQSSENKIATITIKNSSASSIKVNIGVATSETSTNSIEYLDGKKLISGTIKLEESKLLSTVPIGSYVKYTGTNGCSGKSCGGQNANYVSDSDMGYCDASSYKFNSNGWRVAYINDGTAYLTSGGSPECMCTDSSGNAGTSCSNKESTGGVPKHLANLNTKALTYCNSTYAYGGVCNSSSAWNMSDGDFQKITGDTLSTAYNKGEGHYDDFSIINNGGYYWFATPYSASSSLTFRWIPSSRRVISIYSNYSYGVRPVLRLKSSVIVTGGTGTYEDPYTISSGKTKLSEVAPGSYVKYTGTNGCSGKSCEGQNANYVSDSNMGYCYASSYKFNSNGWRVAYINDGTAYLTSGGSPECMCTDSSGNAGTSCSSNESTGGVPKHLANLNTKALTYCNSTYAYGGVCNSSSAWNMSDGDFQKITEDTLSTALNKGDGYYDDYAIINNGGYYWFATPDSASSSVVAFWYPYYRNVSLRNSSNAHGVRPVLRLKSSVIATGGSGTENDPYILSPN